jgi:hypothetical protein
MYPSPGRDPGQAFILLSERQRVFGQVWIVMGREVESSEKHSFQREVGGNPAVWPPVPWAAYLERNAI